MKIRRGSVLVDDGKGGRRYEPRNDKSDRGKDSTKTLRKRIAELLRLGKKDKGQPRYFTRKVVDCGGDGDAGGSDRGGGEERYVGGRRVKAVVLHECATSPIYTRAKCERLEEKVEEEQEETADVRGMRGRRLRREKRKLGVRRGGEVMGQEDEGSSLITATSSSGEEYVYDEERDEEDFFFDVPESMISNEEDWTSDPQQNSRRLSRSLSHKGENSTEGTPDLFPDSQSTSPSSSSSESEPSTPVLLGTARTIKYTSIRLTEEQLSRFRTLITEPGGEEEGYRTSVDEMVGKGGKDESGLERFESFSALVGSVLEGKAG